MSDYNNTYWGPVTSNVDWCESNYAYTPYIAEFWNTLSSLVIAINALFGMITAIHQKYELRYFVCQFLVFIVGIGSVAFHGTLQGWAQCLDELPMVYASIAFFYAVVYTEREKDNRRYLFIAGLIIYSVCFTILYFYLPEIFFFFLGSYVFILGVILYKCYYIYHDAATSDVARRYIVASSFFYIAGSVLFWMPDYFLCKELSLQSYPLHPLFHVFAAFGPYFWVVFSTFHRAQYLGSTPTLNYVGSIMPYVQLKHKQK